MLYNGIIEVCGADVWWCTVRKGKLWINFGRVRMRSASVCLGLLSCGYNFNGMTKGWNGEVRECCGKLR